MNASAVVSQMDAFAAAKQLGMVVATVLIRSEGDPEKALEKLAALDTSQGPDGTREFRSVAEQAIREVMW